MLSKLDLDAILALAEGYEARMKLARSFFDRREPVPEEHKAYLAILDNDEAVKAFESLRPLVELVRRLEKALIKLVKIEVPLPECAVCWDRDECTDRAHGDDCLAIRHIIDVAKEAAKEG